MADSKPTIIFVPGAWHSPEVFSTVRTSLETHGYRTLGITLPSVGAEPPLKTWDPDVDAIRAAIQKAVDEEGGRDVVLAVHSYGGLPASEACKGFAKADREKSGSKGGVVRLVYICAALVNVGTRMVDLSTAGDLQKMAKIDGDRIICLSPTHYFYNDLPAATAEYWASQLTHHSLPTLAGVVTYAAWRHIPTTYLVCEADNALELPVQEAMLETARAAGVDVTVERCGAGHSPFLSAPGVVVGLIRRGAGEAEVV